MTKEQTLDLRTNLAQFTGTEGYHRFSILCRNLVLTDGAKYLAEKAGAYWLMDVIGSVQGKSEIKKLSLQVVKMKVKDSKGVITIENGNGKVLYTQEVHTDFPLDEITLYVGDLDETNKVVLLTSEY